MLVSWMLPGMQVCARQSFTAMARKRNTFSRRPVAVALSLTMTTTDGWTFSFCQERDWKALPRARPIAFIRTIATALLLTSRKKQDFIRSVGPAAFALVTTTTTALTTFSVPALGRTFSIAITVMVPSRM